MAVAFISTAKTFVSSNPFPSTHSSSSNKKISVCMATPEYSPICSTKRSFGLSLTATLLLSMAGRVSVANAAILEADDDQELLERVKKDRQKRIERQGFLSSSKKETEVASVVAGYLQDLVYKLSYVGQAIENNDLNAASSLLGPNTDTDWIKKANAAFNKLSSSPEQKSEIDTFNSSIAKLILSVDEKDVETSKTAFVSSAAAFEKWTVLTGINEQLKGL